MRWSAIPQRVGEFRVGRLQIILRLHKQELGLRQVYVGKTDVEAGPQFIFFQRGDLIGDELAVFHRFLGDLQYRLRLQDGVVGGVHLQQNIGPRGSDVHFLRLGVKLRAFHQFVSAAKIGDQLLDRDAVREAIVDDGVVQRAGGDAAVVLRFHARGAAEGVRIVIGASLGDLRFRRGGEIGSRLDLRMILNGDFLRFLQGEALWRRRRR